MNKALDNLLERRSIRSYKPGQISDDELKSVLKAGLAAPSAMNRQPTVLLVVQDKATIQLLSKLNALVMGKEGIDPFYGAPTVIVVLSDRNIPTHVEDGSLVLGNLMNAANALGLGSCWINRAREVFEMPEARRILRENGIGDSISASATAFSATPTAKSPRQSPCAKTVYSKFDFKHKKAPRRGAFLLSDQPLLLHFSASIARTSIRTQRALSGSITSTE